MRKIPIFRQVVGCTVLPIPSTNCHKYKQQSSLQNPLQVASGDYFDECVLKFMQTLQSTQKNIVAFQILNSSIILLPY